jgi:hypothetical protein
MNMACPLNAKLAELTQARLAKIEARAGALITAANSAPMSDPQDKPFVASATWYLNQALVTGRYSAGLIREFDAHVDNRTANIFPIFAEIASLEGGKSSRASQTKPAAQFTGKWLNGLWHKHYAQAQFMRKNLALHWNPNVSRG